MRSTINILFCFIIIIDNINAQAFVTNDGLALTLQSGLTATIQGAYTNQTNGSLGTIDNAGTITLTGDWTNNSANTVFTASSGTVQFIGTAAQTIGGTNSTGFNNLTINNTSATGITVGTSATIAGVLTLTDAYVYTSPAALLILNDNATSSSGSASSFIDGPIRKIGDDAFIFPTGKDVAPAGFGAEDVWARLGISAPATATTQFTARYYFTPYSDLTMDATLSNVSQIEYWNLERAINADNVNVTLYFENASRSGITDYTSSDFVVARYNGVDWTDNGQSAISGADPGWVTSALVSFFNTPFTFGSTTALPIELLSFTANCYNHNVVLKWITATETNNDFFTLERSTDGIIFASIGTVQGAGNSSTIKNYSFTDNKLETETIFYYRLKQTDFDGKFECSDVIAAKNCRDDLSEFIIYPNPNSGIFIVESNANKYELIITNVFGEKLFSQKTQSEKSKIDLSNQPDGIYLLQIKSENETISKKIIINK